MLLNILGLPKDVKYSEIKDIIKNDCKIESFLLDNMVLDDDKRHKKIRIGVADESEGEILMQRLNGCRISGQVITVVPIGKTTQPQMKPSSDYGNAPHVATQGQYMGQSGTPHWQGTSQWPGTNEASYRGAQSLNHQSFPGQFESSGEGYGSKFPANTASIQNVNTFGGYPSKTQAAYPNVMSKDHFQGPSQYDVFSSDKNYRDQSSHSNQSWKQPQANQPLKQFPINSSRGQFPDRTSVLRAPDVYKNEPIGRLDIQSGRHDEPMGRRDTIKRGIEPMERRDPPIRHQDEPMRRVELPIGRGEPIRTREVNLGRSVEPITNRNIHEPSGQRNDTMGLLNIQSQRDVTMGRRDAPPMGVLETSMRRSDIPIGRSEPMKHHNNEGLISEFSRQYERTGMAFAPKHDEVIDSSRGFRIDGQFPKHHMGKVDENRAVKNDYRGNDVIKEERRWDIEREGKGDNIQGNIRREVSFSRVSPDRQSFNRMKRDSPGRFSPHRYDEGQRAAPNMKQVRPAYEPISTPQESNQAIYSVGYQPRLTQNIEYPTPGLRFEARELQERNISYPIKNPQVAEIRSRNSTSPLRHASPDKRDRYQRSHSPRSPRRSWNLEKRRSPQANQEISTPAWPNRRQDYPKPEERPWEKPAPSRDQPRFESIRNEYQNSLPSWKNNLQGRRDEIPKRNMPVHANPGGQAPAPRFDRRRDYQERPSFKKDSRNFKKDAHVSKPFGHPSEPRGVKREFPNHRERSPPRKEPRFAGGNLHKPQPSRNIDSRKPSEPKILDPSQRNRAVNTISLKICARNNVKNIQVQDELKVFLHTRMNNAFGDSEVPYNDLLAWFSEKYSSRDEDIMISDIIAVLKQKKDTSKGSRVSPKIKHEDAKQKSKREDEKPKLSEEKPKLAEEKPNLKEEKPKLGEAKPMTQKELIKEKYKQTIDEIRRRILIKKNMKPNNEDFKSVCEELSLTLLRILLKFGEKFGPLCDINSKYKATYTEKDEDEMYEEVLKAVQKKKKRPATEQPDSVPSKIAKTSASDISCEGEDESKPVFKEPDAVKNAPSGTNVKQANPKAKGTKKPKQPPPPKKPLKLYKPDKQIIDVDMSKFTKQNEDGSVELTDVMSLALDQELQKIKELVSDCIPDPKTATPEEKAVLEAGILDGLTNALGLNITKNLLNVHNQLKIKIFSKHPLPSNFKSVMYSKLRIKGIVKKSINLEYYEGFVDTYEDFYLATLQGKHVIGPMTVFLSPIYNFVIVPPKVKTKFTRASIGCKDSKPKAKTSAEAQKTTEVVSPTVPIKEEADEVKTELKNTKKDTANENKTATDINPAKTTENDETKNGNCTEVDIPRPSTISNESTNINEINEQNDTQNNKDDVTENVESKTSKIVDENDDVCKDTKSITKNEKVANVEVNKDEMNVAINDIEMDDKISTDTNEKHNSESDSTTILNSGIVLDECVGSDCDDQ